MKRRNFMKSTAGLGMVALSGCSMKSIGTSEAIHENTFIPGWDFVNPNYGCYDEWGPLKEVLVGRGDTYVLPKYDSYYDFAAIAKTKDKYTVN